MTSTSSSTPSCRKATGTRLAVCSSHCSATYRLKARVAGDLRFAGRLSVVATRRSDGATIFSGPITRLGRFDLGRFGAGQQETFRLRVMLTSTGTDKGDNVLQGRSASVAFTWTATQV